MTTEQMTRTADEVAWHLDQMGKQAETVEEMGIVTVRVYGSHGDALVCGAIEGTWACAYYTDLEAGDSPDGRGTDWPAATDPEHVAVWIADCALDYGLR